MKSRRLNGQFGEKHQEYIARAVHSTISVAEGAVRAGKTVDNVAAFAYMLDHGCPDRIHLATGSTSANAKLNIGDCNGMGLEFIFRGRCRWTKYKGNEALAIKSGRREYVVIFAGSAKADSYKKIRGNSYGMWIATEINLHHPDTIKEAFNRLLAAKRRRILWDLNPSPPNHPIYTEYIDTFAEKFAGRYNYEKFRIWDNATLSPERLAEIEGEYTPGTFWYRRDIQGERCAAEGVIYETLANNPGGVVIYEAPSIMYATIGVDFGGNGSATAFNLTGYTRGLRQVVTLAEWRKQGVITPADVEENFIRFVQAAQRQYIVTDAYCDSAEQTLIRGLVVACARARIGISIHNARKGPIIDRIRFFCKLHDQGRHKIMHTCTNTLEAFRNAVWDGKPIGELIRLDNGRYDIDSLDAQEYAVEPLMRQIIEVSNV